MSLGVYSVFMVWDFGTGGLELRVDHALNPKP